jgi:hypothetical protein
MYAFKHFHNIKKFMTPHEKKSRREKVSKKYKGRRYPKITMGEGIQKV